MCATDLRVKRRRHCNTRDNGDLRQKPPVEIERFSLSRRSRNILWACSCVILSAAVLVKNVLMSEMGDDARMRAVHRNAYVMLGLLIVLAMVFVYRALHPPVSELSGSKKS